MRLITRSDFDGLVCAMLFKKLDMINEIKFVHPKDMQDGTVTVSDNDILTNVPYVAGCGMWFDHHASELKRSQDEGFTSFVGLEAIPIRHGLTVGELLAHFFARDGKPLGTEGALSVVSAVGWERHRTASAWGRPFMMPSPNMPALETALVYAGGCLVEGTNLSEGRGTTVPFQVIGAPFLDGRALAEALRGAALPGVQVHPATFTPTFEKHAGQKCRGVMLHVTEPEAFRPVMTYLQLITYARAQAPEAFAFRTEPYEFAEKPAFDVLTGSSRAREAILGGASASVVAEIVTPVDPSWREVVSEAELRLETARA